MEGRHRAVRRTDKDGKEQRSSEIRIDELKMLRRAPKIDPAAAAAKALASIEMLVKDIALSLRIDVSLADVASILNTIRTRLVGGNAQKDATNEAPPQWVAP